MKEFAQWMTFFGVGFALFLYGLIAAKRESKSASRSSSENLRSETLRHARHA